MHVQINRHLQACQRIAQVTKFEWQTGCNPAVAIHNLILSQNLHVVKIGVKPGSLK